jgi:hypothetical protein
MASSSSLSQAQVTELQQAGDFAIKSESTTPKLGEFGLHVGGVGGGNDRV